MALQEASAKQKTCFVIGPIGKEDSDTRRRSDTLLEHIFKPALNPLGYEVVRADKISEPGSITIQVLERILQADVVIADLTDHNPNVFYELAVRHGLNKGVVHVICVGQSIPFDIADLRTIHITLDIPGAVRAKEEIVGQVQKIESGEYGQNPIGLAGVLTRSDSGQNDTSVLIREMVDRLSDLAVAVRDLKDENGHLAESTRDQLKRIQRQVSKAADLNDDAVESKLTLNEMEKLLEDKEKKRLAGLTAKERRNTDRIFQILANSPLLRNSVAAADILERAMDLAQNMESYRLQNEAPSNSENGESKS